MHSCDPAQLRSGPSIKHYISVDISCEASVTHHFAKCSKISSIRLTLARHSCSPQTLLTEAPEQSQNVANHDLDLPPAMFIPPPAGWVGGMLNGTPPAPLHPAVLACLGHSKLEAAR
jgi:hypothetical protein